MGEGVRAEQQIVKAHDARPIGVGGRRGARVAGGDRGLQHVRPRRAAEGRRAVERCEPAVDEQAVPEGPVLLEQQDGLAASGRGARPRARRLDLHQRDEPVHLRLRRHQLRQDPP